VRKISEQVAVKLMKMLWGDDKVKKLVLITDVNCVCLLLQEGFQFISAARHPPSVYFFLFSFFLHLQLNFATAFFVFGRNRSSSLQHQFTFIETRSIDLRVDLLRRS
jgi:hypothetical protein